MRANYFGFKSAIGISSFLLLLESFLVLSLGIYMIALGLTHDKAWMPYLSVIGFTFAGSAGLFAVHKGVKECKRWANSPAILANLIALGVAKYQFEARVYWIAVPISTMAIMVIVTLLIQIKNATTSHTPK